MFFRKRQIGPGRAILAWALLAAITLPGLARDKDGLRGDPPPPPPEPNPVEIEVPRGGPVTITLSAYSLTSPIIRYRIRRQPKGQLGTPQIVTADTAVVRYRPPAGAGPGEDGFAYQVQSEGGVSAPAEVRIHIIDKDPVLVAPLDLDFGEVIPGGTARRTLVLENIGGGVAEGTVRVPDGWSVEGDADYKLGAGDKQSFTVVFKPMEQRPYTGDVEYTGNPSRATDLEGKEVAPVTVAAAPFELKQVGTLRVGRIPVANNMDRVEMLRVTAGPHLQADPTVNAPAKSVTEIVVLAKAGETKEIHDHVMVQGEGVKVDIPVHAAPLRPLEASGVANAPAGSTGAAGIPANPSPLPTAPLIAPGRPAGALATPAPNDAMPEPITLPPPAPDQAAMGPRLIVLPLELDQPGQNDARVACDFKGTPPVLSYRLEAQTITMDAKGKAQVKWIPLADAKIEEQGSRVTAGLGHLRPAALYVVRLVGLDDMGRVVALSSAQQVWTARAKEGQGWIWLALGAAVAGGIGVWRWRKRTVP